MDTGFYSWSCFLIFLLFIAGGRAMVSVPGAALATPGAVTITAALGVVLHNATV